MGRGGLEPLSWSLGQVVGEEQEMSSEMQAGVSCLHRAIQAVGGGLDLIPVEMGSHWIILGRRVL